MKTYTDYRKQIEAKMEGMTDAEKIEVLTVHLAHVNRCFDIVSVKRDEAYAELKHWMRTANEELGEDEHPFDPLADAPEAVKVQI